MFEDVVSWSDAALAEELDQTRRQVAMAHARQLAVIAEMAAREQVADVQAVEKSWVRDEVAWACQMFCVRAAA